MNIKNTKIYSVFPACGKTYLCEHQEDYDLKILDSDSSKFSWIYTDKDEWGDDLEGFRRIRNPDFPNNYIKHIKDNIGKYDCIFVSSHASVREAFDKEGIDFTVVYPKQSCKAEWDEWGYSIASFGNAYMEEYAIYNDRYYDDRESFKEAYYDYHDDELCEKFNYNPRLSIEDEENNKNSCLLDEYLDSVADKYFKKAIVVYIHPYDED